MAESVTVEHGGVSITTNTASEADLRTEMEAPPAQAATREDAGAHREEAGEPPAPVRDDKGRFAPKSDAAAAPETPAPAAPPADPAAPARRRDDTLPRHNPIARLNQALAQKADADRRAAQLEAELARYRQPELPPAPSAPVAPSPVTAAVMADGFPPHLQWDQFVADHPQEPDPYTAFLDAKVEWRFEQRDARLHAQWESAQAEKMRTQSFKARIADGKTTYPDFDQVLTEADTLGLQVSAVMREAIADSPKAADLVYYLATHPEECTQLAEESVGTPVAAATVMRRLLESQLAPRAAPSNGSGPAARASVSTAKPPVTPVGSSPVVSDAPPGDEASAAEHARYWNRRLKVPGTR